MPLTGISDGTEYKVAGTMSRFCPRPAISLLFEVVETNPRGYLRGLARNALILGGLAGWESDSAGFRAAVLAGSGSVVRPGPPGTTPLGERFRQTTRSHLLARGLHFVAPVFDVLVFLGVIASLLLLPLGVYRRDPAILAFTLLPLAFLALHALVLSSQDRMAVPVWPVMLANLVLLPGWLPAILRERAAHNEGTLERADRVAFRALVAVLIALAATHTAYSLLSRAIPTSDEAHYMTGVANIGVALHTLSPRAVWTAYVNALGFKPPLICLPAAAINAFVPNVILASKLALIFIFLALGLAGYSLFRSIFRPVLAASAALLLVTAPVITGLTHRFYVEGLTLLMVMLFLDLLLRVRFRNWRGVTLLGFVLGLGLLTKPLVPPLLVCPILFLFAVEYARTKRANAGAYSLVAKSTLLALVAAAVALTWHGHGTNFMRVVSQTMRGSWDKETAFPVVSAFLSMISCGPYIFVSALAAVGLVVAVQRFSAGRTSNRHLEAWCVILLSSGTAVLLSLCGGNQSIRYIAAALPLASILSVYGTAAICRSSKALLGALGCLLALSVVLVLHNSFRVLPIGPLRVGNLRFLDSGFPLNAPDWFDDNHPLDRRDFGVQRVFDYIAANSRQPTQVGVLVHGIVINHDYLGLLAQLSDLPIRFLPWYWTPTSGPKAPDYMISCTGCGSVYPGRHYYDRFAGLRDSYAHGRGGYRLAFETHGDAGCTLLVFRKNQAGPNP